MSVPNDVPAPLPKLEPSVEALDDPYYLKYVKIKKIKKRITPTEFIPTATPPAAALPPAIPSFYIHHYIIYKNNKY
jgi:hypothetical protein